MNRQHRQIRAIVIAIVLIVLLAKPWHDLVTMLINMFIDLMLI